MKVLLILLFIATSKVVGQVDCSRYTDPAQCLLLCGCGTCSQPNSTTWICTTPHSCALGNVYKPANCTPSPTFAPSPSPPPTPLSDGAVAGIIVGSIVGSALLLWILCLMCKAEHRYC